MDTKGGGGQGADDCFRLRMCLRRAWPVPRAASPQWAGEGVWHIGPKCRGGP